MPNVPVVMLVAAVAVLVGVIAVALGRGGELAYFQPDYAPLRLDEVTATDVVLFRPPISLWGYHAPATDEALSRIADALTERDIEINALRRQVDFLRERSLRLFRDDPEPAGLTDYPGPDSYPGPAPLGDDEEMGRLPGDQGEPSGLGWADPPGTMRFPDDQLSGTTPTGSGFPATGPVGPHPPWSPAPRPPAGRPPWPPAVRPPDDQAPGPQPPGAAPAVPHTVELPRRLPPASHEPSASLPRPAPESATDQPPDFPGRDPRPPRPPRPPGQEEGW